MVEAHDEGLGARPRPVRAPNRRRWAPEPGAEEGVEAAHAREPRRERDLGEGERGVLEQALGQREPPRLRELHRRDAQLGRDRPAQVTRGHPQVPGERFDAAPIEEALVDVPGGPTHEPRHGVGGREARRQLGTAAEARAEPGPLRLGSALEERAAGAPGRARRADGAAVDAGGADADEEHPVEAAVARAQGAVAGVGVELHEPFLGVCSAYVDASPSTAPNADFGVSQARNTFWYSCTFVP